MLGKAPGHSLRVISMGFIALNWAGEALSWPVSFVGWDWLLPRGGVRKAWGSHAHSGFLSDCGNGWVWGPAGHVSAVDRLAGDCRKMLSSPPHLPYPGGPTQGASHNT